MRDLPYVPFFTGDWLASSARVDMMLAERAIYLDLLFQLWERGGAIPSDENKLAKMALVTPAEFAAAWPEVKKYFVAHPDEPEKLTNLKMLDVIRKQADVHAARSNSGRRGAESRWHDGKGDGKTDGKAVANGWHPETETESESKTEADKHIRAPQGDARDCPPPIQAEKKARADQAAWFASWWEIYFLKRGRKAAFAAFCRALKTEERFNEVMEGTRAQSPEMLKREEKHRPHGSTWLNGERWLDPAEEPRRDPILDAMYPSKEQL